MELQNPNCQCSWMAHLEKEIRPRKLKNLILPGAHDSNTYSISKLKTLAPFARCQTKSLFEQLCLGIRFLDLRVGHFLSEKTKHIVQKDISENSSLVRSTQQSSVKGEPEPATSNLSTITKNSASYRFRKGKTVFELDESEKKKIALRFKGSIFGQKLGAKSGIDWELDFRNVVGSYRSGIPQMLGKSTFYLNFVNLVGLDGDGVRI